MFVCIYMYMYMNTHAHTHTHTHPETGRKGRNQFCAAEVAVEK